MFYSLVILDRDGVINFDSPDYIKSPEEWHPIPGSLEAIASLNQVGCTVVIATNQSGVGRGYYSVEVLESIHRKMHDALAQVQGYIDRIYYCPHTPEMQCACRKPKPGMLWQIKDDFPELFERAILVGDSLRDVQAAQAADCSAALVKTGITDYSLALDNVSVYPDLSTCVKVMLKS